MQVEQHLEMCVRIPPGLESLTDHARRLAALRQSVMWKVVVENDVGDMPSGEHSGHHIEKRQHMRFQPHLRADVRHEAWCCLIDCLENLCCELLSAHPAFPADELRQDCRRYTIGGKLCLSGDKTFGHLLHRTAPRSEVALEPITMNIDDARQHGIALQIDLPPSGPVLDAPTRDAERVVRQAIGSQKACAGEFKV